MSRVEGLQQALKNNSGKAHIEPVRSDPTSPDTAKPAAKARSSSKEGKNYIGSWLNPDFGASLRLVQLRRHKETPGRKIFLDDLLAEALNDLFLKYDVPTVHHE